MKDILDTYVEENNLCTENIFKYLDAYSIYSYYIGQELELATKYSSPLRQGDEDPSFALYYSKKNPGELLFKDHGSGTSGNVFKFLSIYLGLTVKEVLAQINHDFELGLSGGKMGDFKKKIVKSTKHLEREKVEIEITSKPYSKGFLNFWSALGVTIPTLQMYNVKDLKYIHYVTKSERKCIAPQSLCMSYEILGTYKIYQPGGPKEFKFRNNYHYGFVEGALQLQYKKPFIIITKSTKECIFFREHFDWDAIAGTSENTMIIDYFMTNTVFKNYKKVFVWLDNDEPGIKAQQKYLEKYPTLIPIHATEYEQKDPTDMYKFNTDKQLVLSYIRSLIEKKLYI